MVKTVYRETGNTYIHNMMLITAQYYDKLLLDPIMGLNLRM